MVDPNDADLGVRAGRGQAVIFYSLLLLNNISSSFAQNWHCIAYKWDTVAVQFGLEVSHAKQDEK